VRKDLLLLNNAKEVISEERKKTQKNMTNSYIGEPKYLLHQ